MKRIYKNNDLIFNLSINNFPINTALINSIEFRFYTINSNNCIIKTHDDIDVYNQIILQWDELKTLEEGVLHYDYTVKLNSTDMNDGTLDSIQKVMTNYYLVNDVVNVDINTGGGSVDVDLSDYYTRLEINNKLKGYVEDDVLGSYYTKNEVNELIDNIDIPITDLTNYYNKQEVNNLIEGISVGDLDLSEYSKTGHTHEQYLTGVPSEYITETELNNKGYLTQHQSLDEYSKTGHTHEQYLTGVPSEYITETELNNKGYLTQHQSLANYATKSDLNNISHYKPQKSYIKKEVNEIYGGHWLIQCTDFSYGTETVTIECIVGWVGQESEYQTMITSNYIEENNLTGITFEIIE